MGVRSACLPVLLILSALTASAQEARIRVVMSSADDILTDLKDIVQSTPNKGLKKEWKNLEATIVEGFLVGVDKTKPLRLDLLVTKDGLLYEPSLPIAKLKSTKEDDSFIENLNGFDYVVRAQPNGTYQITAPKNKGFKPMFMREVKNYVIISGKMPPAGAENPINDVKALLAAGYDVAAELKNDAAGADARRTDFQALRKELEAAIKFKQKEDPAEFEFRKLSAAQMFNELQRFVVEADTLKIGWTTNPGAKLGTGDLLLTALPGTALEASIQQLATQPGYFANVQLHDKPALSGKIQFPFDDFRKQEAKARHPAARDATKVSFGKLTTLTDAGKDAAKKAITKLFDIFDASLDIGLEGFLDVHDADDGKYTFVGGLRANKTELATDIVELLPAIRDDWKVKLKAAEHGGVTIHEATVSERRRPEYDAIFGGEPILYVGVSDKAVWAACGKHSLEELKAAIDQQALPAPEKADSAFFTGTMKFGPWVKLLDVMRQQEPKVEKQTKQELAADKERDRLRSLALEAFAPGDELLVGRLVREGNEVKGDMSINEGVFHFLGSAIADFSKQNLR